MLVDRARSHCVWRPIFFDRQQERLRTTASFGVHFTNDRVRFVEELDPVLHLSAAWRSPPYAAPAFQYRRCLPRLLCISSPPKKRPPGRLRGRSSCLLRSISGREADRIACDRAGQSAVRPVLSKPLRPLSSRPRQPEGEANRNLPSAE